MIETVLAVLVVIALIYVAIKLLGVLIALVCLPFAAVWCWIDNRRRARLPAG